MEYTEGQQEEIRAEFCARRRRQLLVSLPLLLLALGTAFLEKGKQGAACGISASILLPVFLVLVIGAIAFSLYNWRCPACNRYLGKQWSPKYCSRCGVMLQ